MAGENFLWYVTAVDTVKYLRFETRRFSGFRLKKPHCTIVARPVIISKRNLTDELERKLNARSWSVQARGQSFRDQIFRRRIHWLMFSRDTLNFYSWNNDNMWIIKLNLNVDVVNIMFYNLYSLLFTICYISILTYLLDIMNKLYYSKIRIFCCNLLHSFL